MKKRSKILLITLLFFSIQKLHAQSIFLVNPDNKEIITPVGVSSVKASDWNNACGDLQAAINAAGSVSPGGQVWVMKGTCLPALDESFQMKEGVKVYGHFQGTETSIEQRNLADKASETILQGNGKSVLSAEKLSFCLIDGVTITGGVGTRFNVVGSSGGGIFISETAFWMSHCNITDNMASETGGGLLIYNKSSATITDCIIQNNATSFSRGGGMYILLSSHAYIKDCDFNNNYSNTSGGAILSDLANSVALVRCKFNGNRAGTSGGAYLGTGDAGVTMDNCIFTNNSAESSAGGALFFTGTMSTLNNCVLSNNHAKSTGGGIYATGAVISLRGCVIENNTSETGVGGGVGPLQITNCVIFNNRTTDGATVGISTTGYLKNSIVWANNAIDDSGLPRPQINNSATVSTSIIQGGYGGIGNIDADPLFVNASNPAGADNVLGTTDDGLRLRACSPGVDAGISSEGIYSYTDIAGGIRYYNTRIDIGPYEYQGDKEEQILASNYELATQDILSGQKAVYLADGMDCKLVATIESVGTQPVTGSITSRIWIDETQSGQFVKRHYQITPAYNALSATARITLYATDAEFSDYNAKSSAASSFLPLSTDNETLRASRISNVKIQKYSGVSSDGTGQPQTYTGSSTVIDPVDKDIVWNQADRRWEITFNVTGFSGFFIKTVPVPLPVHWVSVTASLNQENNAVIYWKVQETSVASYSVQKSLDAQRFETVGKLQGLGDGMHEYRFTDANYLTSQSYYRISQTDLDGTTTLSRIVTIDQRNSENASIVYPVPAKNEVFVLVKSMTDPLYQITVTDLNGKKLKTQTLTTGNNKVDISKFTQGLYLLKTSRGEVFKIVKE